MAKKKPNILYSAGTELAYKINETFYNDLHYVWCTNRFGSPSLTEGYNQNPASSDPWDIYQDLSRASGENRRLPDHHSVTINRLRIGLKKGTDARLAQGVISKDEHDEIYEIVDAAERQDFSPLIYVIPFEKVQHIIKSVPVHKRAHPLSDEWVIEELTREFFDLLRF